MQGKTAIIGNGESVLAFKAGGVDAFSVDSPQAAKETLRKLAKRYSVIFITDDLAEGVTDLISRFNEQPYPIVVPVPSEKGAGDFAINRMKEQMEMALGVDILFNREEK